MDQDDMITDLPAAREQQQESRLPESGSTNNEETDATEMREENETDDEAQRQTGVGGPIVPRDVDFPPLPSSRRQDKQNPSQTRLGKVRLIFGRGQHKDVEAPKRPQPPSPSKDRTLKRHASMADPPVGSEDHTEPPPELGSPQTPSPGERGSQRHGPQGDLAGPPRIPQHYSFGDGFASTPYQNSPGLTSAPTQRQHKDYMEIDDFTMERSATTVADSEWDDFLNNSPIPARSTLSSAHEIGSAQHKPSRGAAAEGMTAKPIRTYAQAQKSTIHPDVKAENYIVTNATGLQRTATPSGGWPKIHRLSSPLDNVVPSQIAAWNKVITGKLWARTFRGKYETNSMEMVDKTRALIKSLVYINSEVSLGVSFPLQEHARDTERFPSPYHMLVLGLSPAQVNHLVNLETVSTKDITVFFKSFNNQRPTFVLTIFGLTFGNSTEEQAAVTNLVKSCVKDSEAIMKHITDCAPKLSDRVANDIFNNISVMFLEVKRNNASGGNFRGWNVFLHHSYLSNEDHMKLIQLMRMCTFPSATSGFGLLLRGKDTLLCVNCKSIDHDMLNCPFPNLPGWLGYKSAPEQQSQGNMVAYGDDNEYYSNERFYYRGRG
ncbi:hypothetical protein C0992_001803 [Termitomyces sp. T32_za158]|nr:hypothetical protein C0992_001803 [Termitomyces sp. T32_za158]